MGAPYADSFENGEEPEVIGQDQIRESYKGKRRR
jgi:hypothetical protein